MRTSRTAAHHHLEHATLLPPPCTALLPPPNPHPPQPTPIHPPLPGCLAGWLQVLADIHDESSKHGTVLRVVVPRPAVPAEAAALMAAGAGAYGKAFVQFLDVEGSKKVRY